MHQLLWGTCGRSDGPMGAANGGSREDVCGPSPQWDGDGLDIEAQVWAKSLATAKCTMTGGLLLGSLEVPPELNSSHRDLLRLALVSNKALRSLTVGDVSSSAARLLAEAAAQAAGPSLVEVKFIGTRADDALARVLGMLLRPVWAAGSPALLHLTIAHPRRNLL